MAETEQIQAILSAVDRGFTSGISRAQSAVDKFKSSVSSNMGTIGKTMTVAGAAIGAMGVKSLKSFGDFEASLNKAAVVAGGTSKDISGLAEVANHMGAVLPISAQDAADAMVEMAKNGASLDDLKKQFPAIAEASTAAGSDLQQTAGVVQQAMNIWGDSLKSPQRAAAILVQTANASNATIESMQIALANVGGSAKNAGFDMGSMSEAIGLLTNKGFTAARASQDLNHAIVSMMAPSDKAGKEIDALGLSFTDASGKMKPFPTILREVAKATDDMSASEKAAALKAMFGMAGMQAMLPLLDSVNDKTGDAKTSWNAYAAEQDKVSSSTAAATAFLANQANEMQQNIGSKIEQVGGNWEALRNKAMAASGGVNGALLDMINNTLTWATNSNSAFAGVIQGFVGMAPAIGAVVMAVGGFIAQFKNILSVFSAFASASGLIVAAVVGLVAAFVGIYNSSTVLRNAISNVVSVFQGAFNSALAGAGTSLQTVGTQIGTVAQLIGDTLGAAINSINWQPIAAGAAAAFAGIVTTITTVVSAITSAFNPAITSSSSQFNALGTVGQAVFTAIRAAIAGVNAVISMLSSAMSAVVSGMQAGGLSISSVWSGLQTIFTTLGTVIQTLVSFVAGLVTGFMAGMQAVGVWQMLGNAVANLWAAFQNLLVALQPVLSFLGQIAAAVGGTLGAAIGIVVGMLGNVIAMVGQILAVVINVIANIITTVVSGITSIVSNVTAFIATVVSMWNAFWNGLVSVVTAVWAAITSGVSSAINGIQSTISTVMSAISSVWSSIWNTIKSVATTVWNAIKSTITTVVTAIQTVITTVFNAIKSVVTSIWNAIKSTTTSVWNGIKSAITSVVNAVKSVITSVFNAIKSVVTSIWNAIKSTTTSVWNGIKSAVSAAVNSVKSVITTVFNSIKSFVASVWNAIRSGVSSAWAGIAGAAGSAARGVFSAIKSALSPIVGFVEGIWSTVSSIFGKIKSGVQSAMSAAHGKRSVDVDTSNGLRSMRALSDGIADTQDMAVSPMLKSFSPLGNMDSSPIASVTKALGSTVTGFNRNINSMNMTPRLQTGNLFDGFNQLAQPANINLSLGGHDYTAFVNDISAEQDNSVNLRRRRL